jgi:polysaccharide export outer membrane protein
VRKRFKFGAVLGAALLVAAISFASQSWSAQPAIDAAAPSALTTGSSRQTDLEDYRLGSGDKVRVNVYGEESLSGEFFVSGDGKVSLPLVGEVQASGLTVKSFQDEVQQAFRNGYLKEPRVSAEVLNYRPFYILGEISHPGEYPYTSGLTVFNAVATAGGFTYRANKGSVYIRRTDDAQEHRFPLTSTTLVAPGDTIRIGERLF